MRIMFIGFMILFGIVNISYAEESKEGHKFKEEISVLPILIRDNKLELARKSLENIRLKYSEKDCPKEIEIFTAIDILLLVKEGKKELAEKKLKSILTEKNHLTNSVIKGHNSLLTPFLMMYLTCDENKDTKQLETLQKWITSGIGYINIDMKQVSELLRVKKKESVEIVIEYEGKDKYPTRTIIVNSNDSIVEIASWPGKVFLRSSKNEAEIISDIYVENWELTPKPVKFRLYKSKDEQSNKCIKLNYNSQFQALTWMIEEKLIPSNSNKIRIEITDESGAFGYYSKDFDLMPGVLHISDVNKNIVCKEKINPFNKSYIIWAYPVNQDGRQTGNRCETLKIPSNE